jgi:regulatory protein
MDKKAYNYAIYLLAKREYSTFEITQKMQAKDYDKSTIDEVLQVLQEQNYQSNLRFAQMTIRVKSAAGYGYNHIKQILKNHQINVDIIAEAFESEDIDWQAVLLNLWQKKYNQKPVDFKMKQKQSAYLAGKGFSFEEIKELFKSY